MPETILLVDDDVKMKNIVAEVLQHEGYAIITAANGEDAKRALAENHADAILCDIKLPDTDGVELLKKFVAMKPEVPVIMISGFATVDLAVSATKLGAYDFLEKPLEPRRVLVTIKNALEQSRARESERALVEDMMSRYGVVGVSESLRKLCATAVRIARHSTPVLVAGENGTGKEKIAEVIHRFSGRDPWIPVNCASIPHELIESELFGHKKGAFTGALSDKVGKFQAADHGTLFLDEIGDMNHDMQAKILRALETKEVCMVGENASAAVDVRFIAATNKNLPAEIEAGRFREDLYYRLRGMILYVPPLRERREDVAPLARHFLGEYSDKQQCVRHFDNDALEILTAQDWRGNVRELKNVVEALAIFSDDETIDHLQVRTMLQSLSKASNQVPASHAQKPSNSLKDETATYEANLILDALKECRGNITHAAEKLNIDRATLSKKIKRYGLKP
ncbi:MAG TPA: sigma-54 dependent transcriptional regulator [Bacteroidota bacterium]|nr:sigma-54 dependent transcriptional regulator [Bacteroidota bacterium]